jgi:hypothetical protein
LPRCTAADVQSVQLSGFTAVVPNGFGLPFGTVLNGTVPPSPLAVPRWLCLYLYVRVSGRGWRMDSSVSACSWSGCGACACFGRHFFFQTLLFSDPPPPMYTRDTHTCPPPLSLPSSHTPTRHAHPSPPPNNYTCTQTSTGWPGLTSIPAVAEVARCSFSTRIWHSRGAVEFHASALLEARP